MHTDSNFLLGQEKAKSGPEASVCCWPQHSLPTAYISLGYPEVVPVKLWSLTYVHVNLHSVLQPICACITKKLYFPRSDCRLVDACFVIYSKLCFIFIVLWVVPSAIIYYLLMTEWLVFSWDFPRFSLLNIGNSPTKYFILRICWFFSIYMVWSLEVGFFSSTSVRVGFSLISRLRHLFLGFGMQVSPGKICIWAPF